MQWFYKLAKAVVWFLFTIWFDIEYHNIENIPKDRGGYITACNHTSYLDPLMIAFKQKPWIRYMAKGELYKLTGLVWLFKWLGTIPVDRGNADMSAIDRCVGAIKDGYVLGIFPEGTRYPQNEPGRPKSGMALIAKTTKADILPCAIRYERPLKFKSKVAVMYGKLIPYAELGLDEDSPRALKRATKRVWGEILGMLGLDGEAA